MIYISNTAWAAETYKSYATINSPLVFYRSYLRPQDIVATTFAPDRPPINMWNPDTSSAWESNTYAGSPSVTATEYITLNNPTGLAASYVAIAAHNLGSQMWSVQIEGSTDAGSTWAAITSAQTILTNDPIVFFFNDQPTNSIFRIKLTLTKSGSPATITPAVIAHVKLGAPLVLYRRIFSGFEPSLVKKSKTIQNGSDSGQYLGQVVIRSYREVSDIEQKNQPYDFVRSDIVPFLNHCNGQSYFTDTSASTFIFVWRPAKHPGELIYGWAVDIKYPANEQGNSVGGYMTWGISVGATA